MIALLFALAWASPQPHDDFRSYLDQAEFFLRKQWFVDARDELLAAVAHPDGRHDPNAWFLLSTTQLALSDVIAARLAAEEAQTNARTIEQAEQAQALATYLHDSYGQLTVTGPDGVSGRIDLELTSMLFDAQAQDVAQAMREAGRKRHLLPYTFGLPAGQWLVNGQSVEITAGGSHSLRLPDSGGPSAVLIAFDSAEFEIGIGIAGWQGAATDNTFPAPTLSAALSWPVGPLDIGVIGSWQPQTYTRADGQVLANIAGGGVGLRIGVPLPDLAPWIIRPAATYRYTWVPGIELHCTQQDLGYDCAQQGPADLLLYAVGGAHTPGAALSIAHLKRTSRFSVGVGVQGAVEHAVGTLAPAGNAQALSDGRDVRYTASQRRWSATGWSVSTVVLFAL